MNSMNYKFFKKAENKNAHLNWSKYGACLVCVVLLLCTGTTVAQPDSVGIHNGSVTTSFAHFYDSGGEYDNYQDNENIIMTVYPEDTTEKICVTFHEFETQSGTNADVLYIYDGNNTSAPLIAQLSGVNYGTISSSSSDGSLTFQFISNSSTNDFGWDASITVDNTPEDITMAGDATWYVSSGRFYDNGGPNADYGDNKNNVVTLFPSNSSDKLSVTFHEFQTQSGTNADILYVYDGNSTSAPLIAQLSGVNYGTISSSASDGSLTFQFVSNSSTNDFGWYASISANNSPKDITMLASGTYTVSSGRFYDNGGPQNDYGDSKDETVTISPQNAGDKLSVTFHECDIAAGDVLYVYDGNNSSAPLIASITGANYGTITSSASDGALTFQFVSDGSGNSSGWHASISTEAMLEDVTMLANGTFTVAATGRFYDNGGPESDYGDNQNVVTTIYPANASNKLSVTFHSFNTQAGSDILHVYDGNSVGAPLIGSYSGDLTVFTVTSTASDGSLTFQFVSDGSNNDYGWYASVTNTSSIPSYNMTASATYTIPSDSSAFFYDSGGPNSNYSANENSVVTFTPANSSDKISISLNYFQTWDYNDYLEVHDGNGITAPLLAKLHGPGGYGTITASPVNATGSLTFKFVSNSGTSNSGGWAAVVTTNANPQNFSLPGTYTLPSGTSGFFYDAGGPGETYIRNMDAVTTINPANSNDKLSVSFNYFRTWDYNDYLEVHDGNSITAPLLAKLHGPGGYGTVTASPANTTGSLTFKFVSNSGTSNSGGWAAVVTTNASPQNISMPGDYTLPSNTTGYFYDAGGPGGNYIKNGNPEVTTIKPANSNDKLSVAFNHFRTYSANDYLEVHDGNSVTAPLLATLHNHGGYGTITATAANATGSLTFRFVTGGGYTAGGWAAVITTNASPQNISMPGEYTLSSNSTSFFYDAGGPGGNYIKNGNPAVTTIMPANSNDKISIAFNHFRTYSASDYLEVFDGNSTTAPLLGTFSGAANPGTITASATNPTGSLTFRFITGGGYTSSGWGAVVIAVPSPTGIAEDDDKTNIPKVFGMDQNYPNPFNPATTINYQLPKSAQVELTIFNLLGQKVTTLVSAFQTAGEKSVVWDGTNAAGQQVGSGIYFYHLHARQVGSSTGDFIQTRKMLLAR